MSEETEEQTAPGEDTRSPFELVRDTLQKGQQLVLHCSVANKPSSLWADIKVPGLGTMSFRTAEVAKAIKDGTLVPGEQVPFKQYEKAYPKSGPRTPKHRVLVLSDQREDGTMEVHFPSPRNEVLRVQVKGYVR